MLCGHGCHANIPAVLVNITAHYISSCMTQYTLSGFSKLSEVQTHAQVIKCYWWLKRRGQGWTVNYTNLKSNFTLRVPMTTWSWEGGVGDLSVPEYTGYWNGRSHQGGCFKWLHLCAANMYQKNYFRQITPKRHHVIHLNEEALINHLMYACIEICSTNKQCVWLLPVSSCKTLSLDSPAKCIIIEILTLASSA